MLHILLLLLLLLTPILALPTSPGYTQRNKPTPPTAPQRNIPPLPTPAHPTCSVSPSSPSIPALQSALSLFEAACTDPLTVPAGKACVNMVTTETVVVDLCGWGAAATCTQAADAVRGLLGACGGQGVAEGSVDVGAGAEGIVRVGRVVKVVG